jgi:hypothetical protein
LVQIPERSGKESKTSIAIKSAALDGEGTMSTEPNRAPRMRSLLKRWWLWALLAVPVSLVPCLVLGLSLKESLWVKHKRIRPGMTMQRVEAIMGSRGRTEDEVFGTPSALLSPLPDMGLEARIWTDDKYRVHVVFDRNNRAKWIFDHFPDYKPTTLEQFRGFLVQNASKILD